MFHAHLLRSLLIIWAIVTGRTLVLGIYRSTLGGRVEDQLYLSEAENRQQQEHEEVVKRVKRLAPFLYVLGSASGVLLLSIIGVWLYRGLLMT